MVTFYIKTFIIISGCPFGQPSLFPDKEPSYVRLSRPSFFRLCPQAARRPANRGGGMRPGLSCLRPWLSRFSHRFAAVAGALQRLAERGDAGRYGAFCGMVKEAGRIRILLLFLRFFNPVYRKTVQPVNTRFSVGIG